REVSRREVDRDAETRARLLRRRAQCHVARHSARDDERARLVLGCEAFGRADERAYNNVLKARGQILHRLRWLLARRDWLKLGLAHVLRDGGLQSTEAEVGPPVAHARHAEADCARVALARELLNNRPAGIAEAEHLRDLVVCLARRVVA